MIELAQQLESALRGMGLQVWRRKRLVVALVGGGLGHPGLDVCYHVRRDGKIAERWEGETQVTHDRITQVLAVVREAQEFPG